MAWLVHEKETNRETESLFGIFQGNDLGDTYARISNCAKNWKQIRSGLQLNI